MYILDLLSVSFENNDRHIPRVKKFTKMTPQVFYLPAKYETINYQMPENWYIMF